MKETIRFQLWFVVFVFFLVLIRTPWLTSLHYVQSGRDVHGSALEPTCAGSSTPLVPWMGVLSQPLVQFTLFLHEILWGIWFYSSSQNLHFHLIFFRGCKMMLTDKYKVWRIHRRTIQKTSLWPTKPQWCDHSPRSRHTGMQNQVGLWKHHYEQS